MNYNTLLIRLGIDPSNFVNQELVPIVSDDTFIYEVRQRADIRICPECGSHHCHVHDHDIVEINCSETDQIKDVLRIIKVRFKCNDCSKTFTPPIRGIDPHSKTSIQTEQMIIRDFFKPVTFSSIAERYSLSSARIIQIFDERISYVPRGKLPAVLCIDEIHFKEEINQNYCCVLYDHDSRTVVDIIRNRQLAYLHDYFSSIPEGERMNVKYFISDMYDAYRTVCRRYFPHALHIVDLFHVISLLTSNYNMIRYSHVKRYASSDNPEIRFMKSNWKLFLCRQENIPDKWYTPKGYGKAIHYTDMVHRCLCRDEELLKGYNILQDLYHYNRNDTFTKSLEFVEYISGRLLDCEDDRLVSVGRSYQKWKIEIADGLAKNQTGRYYSNGVAESLNNHLKTIIKSAYGYHNFERFRKRALLIFNYKKT